MLLKLGGNSSPSQEDIGKLLDVIGDSSDETCLQRLFDGIGDRSVDDLVKEGRDKLCIGNENINAFFLPKSGQGKKDLESQNFKFEITFFSHVNSGQ